MTTVDKATVEDFVASIAKSLQGINTALSLLANEHHQDRVHTKQRWVQVTDSLDGIRKALEFVVDELNKPPAA